MKYSKSGSKFFLTLSPGEYINASFENFATKEGIECAWLSGIGAIKDPEIGFYSLKDKSYQRKRFIGNFELTSLQGNISIKQDIPFSHTHITFSDMKYIVYGGHLFDAEILITGEFIIHKEAIKINRKMDSNIGLHLWCIESS